MTKVIFFISPQSLVTTGTKAAEFVPILGPIADFSRKTKKLTQISDPVTATSQGVGILFNHCFEKAGAITAECALWFGFSTLRGLTCNPTLIGIGTQFGTMVIDELIR